MSIIGKRIGLISLAIGLLSALPLILFHRQGDLFLSYTLMQCFGEQIWTGNFYPRWCMSTNSGYGSPVPIFYFPVPFYISSLFFPLRFAGMEISQIYVLCMALLNIVTFFNARIWLKIYASEKAAILLALLYLFAGYHMEITYFRASFAESWGMAFAPLIFWQVEKLMRSDKRRWPQLACAIAVTMLSHAPTAVMVLMACGIVVLIGRPKKLPALIASAALAYAATLFNWTQAQLFYDTLHPDYSGFAFWQGALVNQYVDGLFWRFAMTMQDHAAWRATMKLGIITLGSTLLMFILPGYLLTKHTSLSKLQKAWICVMVFGAFMMFTPSEPLWNLISALSQIKTPWRMAMLPLFGFLALAAITSQRWHELTRAMRRTGLAVIAILASLGLTFSNNADPESDIASIRLYSQNILGYFHLRWMDTRYIEDKFLLFVREFILMRPTFKALFTDFEGNVETRAWFYDGLVFHTRRDEPGTLRIEHFYHPVWHATVNGKTAELKPEEGSIGRMLVDVPAGASDVILTIDAADALPKRYLYAKLVSIFALLVIFAGLAIKYYKARSHA